MHKIYFYKDKCGREPVYDYISSLSNRSDKDSRIKANKIRNHISYLRRDGLACGEPYIKHLDNGIWELRPLRDRILFASWQGDDFVLLHHFVKKTQKTPQREIDKAKRNLKKCREMRKNG